ncbi:hypothetical protein SNEBB_000879 [Seison nebaliae]|nr:hypothetical protein SNEBB_000879 [Seison nebaliae]
MTEISADSIDWRTQLVEQVKKRNKREQFVPDVISQLSKLFDNNIYLRSRIMCLDSTVEQLRLEREHARTMLPNNSHETLKYEAIESKLNEYGSDLIKAQKKSNDMALQIISLTTTNNNQNETIKEKDKQISSLENDLKILLKEKTQLIIKMTETNEKFQLSEDERLSCAIQVNSLKEKCQQLSEDKQILLRKIQTSQEQIAELCDKESQRHKKEVIDKYAEENRQLADDNISLDPKQDEKPMPITTEVILPKRTINDWVAHDGSVVCLKYHPNGSLLSSGGVDRKLKVWGSDGTPVNTMSESNATVSAVDFEHYNSLLLGTSNDFSCRVYKNYENKPKLQVTFTGHTNKITTAKFVHGLYPKVVSGGFDRTIRVWDVETKNLERTIYANSSVHDLVVMNEGSVNNKNPNGSSVLLLSAHFDKKIRLFDLRNKATSNRSSGSWINSGISSSFDNDSTNNAQCEIALPDKITSLNIAPDMNTLLASSRADAIHLIDLRMNRVLWTSANDDFRIVYDFTRSAFSPNAEYGACGSADGKLFIWDMKTCKLVSRLKSRYDKPLVAVQWHPDGHTIAGSDFEKHIILWQ